MIVGNRDRISCVSAKLEDKRGFTLFELVVVISIISVLSVFALDYYAKLLVRVEQATVEYNIGTLRSALSMQVADYVVKDRLADLPALVQANPFDHLAETPNNYLGRRSSPKGIEPGHWYFDPQRKHIVYLVNNRDYFHTRLAGTPRIRYRVRALYSAEAGEQRKINGLVIRALESYEWLLPE